MSAPSVNQMRFLSSSAFEKADQLMFAASCSAADAMNMRSARPFALDQRLYQRQPGHIIVDASVPRPLGGSSRIIWSDGGELRPLAERCDYPAADAACGTKVLTLPPAFSIASMA